MADWLPVLTAGPYQYLVYRDAVQVTDLDAVGASVEVFQDRITLRTPDGEDHEWALAVVAQGITGRMPMRMKDFAITHPGGITEARALGAANGEVVAEVDLSVNEPTASPDPAELPYACVATVLVVQEGGA